MAETAQLTAGRRRSSRLHERAATHQPRSEATLLGLPTEIRLYIYAYLLPDKKGCQANCACHKPEKDDCELSALQQGKEPRGYLALLLSCRTVFNEAVDMLYKPIIGSGGKDRKVPHLIVTADTISMPEYPRMFCRRHLTYRNGTAGVFERVKNLHILVESKFEDMNVCSCCGEWHHLDPEECSLPFGFDDKSQALDNVRWLAEQLSRSGGFDHLAITVEWEQDDEGFCDPPDIEDSQMLMKPFKALRNVKELKIGSLGTIIEMMMEWGDMDEDMLGAWEEVIAYKTEMKRIVGSNAPVKENPIPLSTWLSFKQIVRRLISFAPQVGAQKFLEMATDAFSTQDKKAFQKASNSLFNEWKEEQKQRKKIAAQFSELRQATFPDIPAGKHKEDAPMEGMESRCFSWGDPSIDKEDRATYIGFLESINS